MSQTRETTVIHRLRTTLRPVDNPQPFAPKRVTLHARQHRHQWTVHLQHKGAEEVMNGTEPVIAAADLIGRSGAKEFAIGYARENVPTEDAGWWAEAKYKGARISVEERRTPGEAAEALAEKILTGAKCQCGRDVTLSDDAELGHEAAGDTLAALGLTAPGHCRWRRHGPRWRQGCEPHPDHAPEPAP